MNAKILVVSPPRRRLALLVALETAALDIITASGVLEAYQKLTSLDGPDLILVDAELPDGSWQDVVRIVLHAGKNCEVVVCSRVPDERLWAEVLQCGAYDLIVEPYEEKEVLRIARSAIDSRYMRRFAAACAAHAG